MGIIWLLISLITKWCRSWLYAFPSCGGKNDWRYESAYQLPDSLLLGVLYTQSEATCGSFTPDASSVAVNICHMPPFTLLPPRSRRATSWLLLFVLVLLVQLLCNIWHFSPSPLSLLLFYKGLSCVLSSNPFKILCTFLNDGNPLTRPERWQSWKPHQKGLLNLLWQRGGMLELASVRSESTFVMFLRKGKEGCGVLLVVSVPLPVNHIGIEGKMQDAGKMEA